VDVQVVVPGEQLHLGGRLSLRGLAGARDAVHAALRAGTGPLVLDLSQVTACDTAGLAMLLSAHRTAAAHGRRLELAALSPAVARALLRTRLHRVLDVRRGAPLPA
jgi:anti-anti-sigma factor